MINFGGMFDSYSLRARLYPGFLTVLPAVIVLVSIVPELGTSATGGAIVALLASMGVLFFMAEIARSCGKRVEGSLLNEWGGWPSTLWLRHSTSDLDHVTKARYHNYLAQSVPGLAMPAAADEAADPAQADGCYASAVAWLKERCRSDFPLVGRENASYGFRRNLLGLKPFALFIAITALLGGAYYAWLSAGKPQSDVIGFVFAKTPPGQLGALAASVLIIAVWITFINRRWVREAADAYARALLSACDKLSQGA